MRERVQNTEWFTAGRAKVSQTVKSQCWLWWARDRHKKLTIQDRSGANGLFFATFRRLRQTSGVYR
jgi:hypothetical protein